MVVPRTTSLQSGCPSKFSVVRTWNKVIAAVECHSWGVKIYGCPSDNCISIFGCPATFLVVPGARTTEISSTSSELLKCLSHKENIVRLVQFGALANQWCAAGVFYSWLLIVYLYPVIQGKIIQLWQTRVCAGGKRTLLPGQKYLT